MSDIEDSNEQQPITQKDIEEKSERYARIDNYLKSLSDKRVKRNKSCEGLSKIDKQ